MTVPEWIAIFVPVGALAVLVMVTAGTAWRARGLARVGVSPSVRRDVAALQQRVARLSADIAGLQGRVEITRERAKAIGR